MIQMQFMLSLSVVLLKKEFVLRAGAEAALEMFCPFDDWK